MKDAGRSEPALPNGGLVMVTIKDVAARAHVSIATVSNYLNQTKPVSRATAARIKEAVEALQYSQNQSAKSLKTNSYPDIGVVLPNLNDSYYVSNPSFRTAHTI